MAYVYGLRAADSSEHFYIGSTKHTPEHRLKQHLEQIRGGHNKNRHLCSKALKIGLENIVIDVLEECDQAHQFKREYEIITEYRERGVRLANLVHNIREFELQAQIQKYNEYELRPDHFVSMLEAYLYGLGRTDNELANMLANVVEKLSVHILENHFDEYMDSFEKALVNCDLEQKANRQAAGIYQRLSGMLECDRSGEAGGLLGSDSPPNRC